MWWLLVYIIKNLLPVFETGKILCLNIYSIDGRNYTFPQSSPGSHGARWPWKFAGWLEIMQMNTSQIVTIIILWYVFFSFFTLPWIINMYMQSWIMYFFWNCSCWKRQWVWFIAAAMGWAISRICWSGWDFWV